MKYERSFRLSCIQIMATLVRLLTYGHFAQAEDVFLGNMKADKVLISRQQHHHAYPKKRPQGLLVQNWGMAARSVDKDYVHLLANKIDTATGGCVRASPLYPIIPA